MTFNYLKLILEYSLRYGSNHILLPDSLHLAQHFLLNNICFSPLIQYDNFRGKYKSLESNSSMQSQLFLFVL